VVASAKSLAAPRFPGCDRFLCLVLYNGLGRYPAALAAAQRARQHEDLGVFGDVPHPGEVGSRLGIPQTRTRSFRRRVLTWVIGQHPRARE